MKGIAILGSTGSIGKSSLDVIRRFPQEFRVIGLSANSNAAALNKQAREFRPRWVHINSKKAAGRLKEALPEGIDLYCGEEQLRSLIKDSKIDRIVLAISGSAALIPLLEAVKSGKTIAMANKEAVVMAGDVLRPMLDKSKACIIPIDSEQSAIWQCLKGHDKARLKNIYLTASGGPFKDIHVSRLKNISVEKVLRHPKWRMGRKISVDSASLMNKGLEVIEAMFLFDVASDLIKVVIHPQALVHSMVEFVDGVILAQLSSTDMRIPIQYALSYPDRFKSSVAGVDFGKEIVLGFEKPDFKKFPCLVLALRAARERGSFPCVLNAANEACVSEFLAGRLDFMAMPRIISKVMDSHKKISRPSLADIIESDKWAKDKAYTFIRAGVS